MGEAAPVAPPRADEDEIGFIVSRWTGIPVTRLKEAETARLLHMEDELHQRVIGQDEAIKATPARSAAPRRPQGPNRPIGSFIFAGPTGVGKTELARALAEFLFADRDALIRVDMSEYMEKFSVSRLIGAPPGYVGYEDSGTLTKAVRRKPYSVVLLDEIEKAHPDVFNILLQVLDEGHLTDNYGRVIDFKNTVVIMTSNVGRSRYRPGEGAWVPRPFRSESQRSDGDQGEGGNATGAFNPEFINRLDDTIVFHPLTREHISQIVQNLLAEVQGRLADEHLTLRLRARRSSSWSSTATTRTTVRVRSSVPFSATLRTRSRRRSSCRSSVPAMRSRWESPTIRRRSRSVFPHLPRRDAGDFP